MDKIPLRGTVHSGDEEERDDSSDDEEEFFNSKKNFFNNNFQFNISNSSNNNIIDDEPVQLFKDSVDLKIQNSSSEEEEDPSEDEDNEPNFDQDKFKDFKKIKNKQQNDTYEEDSDSTDEEEFDKKFFSEISVSKDNFKDMNLSRPLLRVLSELNFHTPTKIQKKSIPILLQGLDVCASAITGSGKTLSFLLPTLERLLHRNKKENRIRVLILLPTRELAKQCHDVCMSLTKYTSISSQLITGGTPYMPQMKKLSKNPPCVLICTPGRLITHILNTSNFSLNHIEILILDEADKLLEMGFKDEFEEIISKIPKNRQSMLFSATMTDDVEELSRVSLKHPVRVSCNPKTDTPISLVQEFIKIRKMKNEKAEMDFRIAILCSLCFRTYKKRVIIFVNRKVDARKLKIIFFLCGKKVSELHGDLEHEERVAELNRFKEGKTNFLIATDLGARGLDILNVKTVINFFMPYTLNSYVHRVGRTARIGKSGVAVSLIDESSRSLLKQIVKRARRKGEEIKHRQCNNDAVQYYKEKINGLKGKINELVKRGEYNKEMNNVSRLLIDTESIVVQDNVNRKKRKKKKKKLKKGVVGDMMEYVMNNNEENNEEVAPVNLKWFQTKKDVKMKKIREREEKQISRSGLKRVRNILEDKILKRRKRKKRKMDNESNVNDSEGAKHAKRLLETARVNVIEKRKKKKKMKKNKNDDKKKNKKRKRRK